MKKFLEGLKGNTVRIIGLFLALFSLILAIYYYAVKPNYNNKKMRSYAMYGSAILLVVAPILYFWNKIKGMFGPKKETLMVGAPKVK